MHGAWPRAMLPWGAVNLSPLPKKRSLVDGMELGKDEVLALKKSRIVDLVDGDLEEIVDEARLADSFAGPMKIIAWNYQGLGSSPTLCGLLDV